MWQTKIFKTLNAMKLWISRNEHKYQWHEIYVNNAYGVEYRPLRVLDC